jgi:hypothetical protein
VRRFLGSCALAFVAACAAEPATGVVQMSLTGEAPSGTRYRLRDADLVVAGAGRPRVLHTEDDPDRAAIAVPLPPGTYTLELAAGWFLERQSADGSHQAVAATLTSAMPLAFSIGPGMQTLVTLRFLVGAEEVVLDDGDLVVDVDIDEVDAAPAPVDAMAPPDAAVPPPDAAVAPDAASTPDAAPPGTGMPVATSPDMVPGEMLPLGERIRESSIFGFRRLKLELDGNLVYGDSTSLPGVPPPVWSSGTAGIGATVLVMQDDGNLVLYRADGSPAWASNTAGHPGAHLLVGSSTVQIRLGSQVLWQRP